MKLDLRAPTRRSDFLTTNIVAERIEVEHRAPDRGVPERYAAFARQLLEIGETPLARRNAARAILDRHVVGQTRAKQAAIGAIANVDREVPSALTLTGTIGGKTTMVGAITEALTGDATRRIDIGGYRIDTDDDAREVVDAALARAPAGGTPLVIHLDEIEKVPAAVRPALAEALEAVVAGRHEASVGRSVVLLATERTKGASRDVFDHLDALLPDASAPRRATMTFVRPSERDLAQIARRKFEAILENRAFSGTVQVDPGVFAHVARLVNHEDLEPRHLESAMKCIAADVVHLGAERVVVEVDSTRPRIDDDAMRAALARGGPSEDLGLRLTTKA